MPETRRRTDLTKIDCRLAIADSDAPVADKPLLVQCREHADSTASCAVYPDHIHCYGCGFTIKKRLDTLGYLIGVWDGTLGTMEYAQMCKVMSVADKYTTEHIDAYRARARAEGEQKPLPRAHATLYASYLWNEQQSRLDWLYGRGLDDTTIRAFMLGHDGKHFTIPFFESRMQGVRTIRKRRDDFYGTLDWQGNPLPKYTGLQGRNAWGAYLYPEWLVAIQQETWVIAVEAELCAVKLRQEGLPAVATFSGAGAMQFIPGLLRKVAPQVTKIYACGDMDEAGQAGNSELLSAARTLGFETDVIGWPSNMGKDPTEYYGNGGTILVKEVDRWGVKALR